MVALRRRLCEIINLGAIYLTFILGSWVRSFWAKPGFDLAGSLVGKVAQNNIAFDHLWNCYWGI